MGPGKKPEEAVAGRALVNLLKTVAGLKDKQAKAKALQKKKAAAQAREAAKAKAIKAKAKGLKRGADSLGKKRANAKKARNTIVPGHKLVPTTWEQHKIMGVVRRSGFASASAIHVALARAIHLHRTYLLDREDQNRMAINAPQWAGGPSLAMGQCLAPPPPNPSMYAPQNQMPQYTPNFYSPSLHIPPPGMQPALTSYGYHGMPLPGAQPMPYMPPGNPYSSSAYGVSHGGGAGAGLGGGPRGAPSHVFQGNESNGVARRKGPETSGVSLGRPSNQIFTANSSRML